MQGIEMNGPDADRMADCMENCLDCHEAALRCIGHCLGRGGAHADPVYIRLLTDCAAIAQTAGDFMLRGSDYQHFTCGVCGKICEHCADACEALGGDDDHMAHCAESCRRCAESCQEMTSHHAHAKDEKELH